MAKCYVYNEKVKEIYKKYIKSLLIGEQSLYINSIGDTIIYFRKKSRIKQTEMSIKLKISKSKYGTFEYGQCKKNFILSEYFEDYLQILNITKHDFYKKLDRTYKENKNKVFSSIFKNKI